MSHGPCVVLLVWVRPFEGDATGGVESNDPDDLPVAIDFGPLFDEWSTNGPSAWVHRKVI